jgi:hypothetical protein
LVVVVVLLLDGDELMLPLEPALPPAEPDVPDEPDEPEPAPMPLELPDEPDDPDEPPELPIDVLLPVLPDEPLAPLPAVSEPPPLPQALRDRAAAATTARAVLRERMDAFIVGAP